jgi:hypothetical protein
MTKRAMYAERIEERSSEGFELLMLYPRTVYANEDPLPTEELERIRKEVTRATRLSRGLVKRKG